MPVASDVIHGCDATAVAVGEIVAAHALRGQVRVRAYQPPAPNPARKPPPGA